MLSGRAPESLLRTYHDEHYPAAANLIAFDKGWSTLMAPQLEDPEAVERYYVAAEEFTAGFLTEYKDNLITAGTEHQALASGFPVGRRFKSDIALRRCDAVTTHIGHEHSADGRWRKAKTHHSTASPQKTATATQSSISRPSTSSITTPWTCSMRQRSSSHELVHTSCKTSKTFGPHWIPKTSLSPLASVAMAQLLSFAQTSTSQQSSNLRTPQHWLSSSMAICLSHKP